MTATKPDPQGGAWSPTNTVPQALWDALKAPQEVTYEVWTVLGGGDTLLFKVDSGIKDFDAAKAIADYGARVYERPTYVVDVTVTRATRLWQGEAS